VKEADSVKIPALPSATQYRAWKIAVRNEVMAASGRGDELFAWICAPEGPKTTFAQFADSNGYGSLDVKIASAIAKIVPRLPMAKLAAA
jgi:hypothetical protein